MASKPKRKPNFLNDIFIEGTLRFPKLNEPDDYGDKPAYKTGILLEPSVLAALKKKLTDFGHKSFPGADLWLPIKKDKKDPSIIFVEVSTKKTDKETGELVRPIIMDAKRKRTTVEVGGGTIAKLKCTGMDYEGSKLTEGRPGVALILEAVQIKVLKQFRDATSGFSDEEGWSADGEQDIEHSEGDDSTEDTSGDAYDL